jgi:hypothetical protein
VATTSTGTPLVVSRGSARSWVRVRARVRVRVRVET